MRSVSTTEALDRPRPRPERSAEPLRFLASAELDAEAVALVRARYVVAMAAHSSAWAGRLGAVIEDAVESALALRGALPPSVMVGADAAATIADQLLRVRALEARGLAIVLPRLSDTAGPDGALSAADSAAIRTWLAAAREAAVELLADDRDRDVALLAPRTLRDVVDALMPRDVPKVAHADQPSPRLHVEQPKPLPIAPPTTTVARAEPKRVERLVNVAAFRKVAVELDAARGPKPIAAVEKLFATKYVPLLEAIAADEADDTIRDVVQDFRSSFEHSYKDGFASLRVTGKRPTMVLDVPDVAARVGRLSGARKIVLLLVDSMRFDLGERVTERLTHATQGRAVCVERHVLWAALPATTGTQLSLFGRGTTGLRDFTPSPEPEPPIERGRGVSLLRRERVGARELMKLDLVEARLRTAGPGARERLDQIADETAPVLGRFIEQLPPRTLVYVFGDHGFRFNDADVTRATGPASQGGATPEEVLVPGYAWLVDGVH